MIHLFVFDCLVLGIPSVLLVTRHKTKDLLDKFSWNDIIEELKQRVPTLLHVLTTVAVPVERVATDHDMPALCTAYSVLMNQRWNELSLLQKVNTLSLAVGHGTKKVKIAKLLY